MAFRQQPSIIFVRMSGNSRWPKWRLSLACHSDRAIIRLTHTARSSLGSPQIRASPAHGRWAHHCRRESAAVVEEVEGLQELSFTWTVHLISRSRFAGCLSTAMVKRAVLRRWVLRSIRRSTLEAQINAQDAINRGLLDLDQRQGFQDPPFS